MSGRKIFLDVGGHIGDSLRVAMEDRWGFDEIWTFEPTRDCVARLQVLADDRVHVVPAGLWSSDTQMVIHDPGTLHASVDPTHSEQGKEVCSFIDAGRWMEEHIKPDDAVWMKINIETAEVEVLSRLLDTGQLGPVRHLVVDFDVEMWGRGHEAIPIRARLDEAGVDWAEGRDVKFGRTDSEKMSTWLALTHSHRLDFQLARAEHKARAAIWRVRKSIRGARKHGASARF